MRDAGDVRVAGSMRGCVEGTVSYRRTTPRDVNVHFLLLIFISTVIIKPSIFGITKSFTSQDPPNSTYIVLQKNYNTFKTYLHNNIIVY